MLFAQSEAMELRMAMARFLPRDAHDVRLGPGARGCQARLHDELETGHHPGAGAEAVYGASGSFEAGLCLF